MRKLYWLWRVRVRQADVVELVDTPDLGSGSFGSGSSSLFIGILPA